jgi:hypothetical protein
MFLLVTVIAMAGFYPQRPIKERGNQGFIRLSRCGLTGCPRFRDHPIQIILWPMLKPKGHEDRDPDRGAAGVFQVFHQRRLKHFLGRCRAGRFHQKRLIQGVFADSVFGMVPA